MDVLEIIIGCLLGIITGTIPGLHVNLLIPFMGSSLVLLGTAISHTFFDFIPNLLLGVPDEGSSIASLPGHRLVMKGRGKEAFLLSVLGGFYSSLALLVILPALFLTNLIKPVIPGILLFSLLVLVFSSKKWPIALLLSFLAILLSFISGPFQGGNLVPFFTGLFGVPTLVFAVLTKSRIPEQRKPKNLEFKLKLPLLASIGGALAGILPGITSSVSAITLDSFAGFKDREKVFIVGGINTVYVLTSFLAIWIIGHPRSGVALALQDQGIKIIPALWISISISALLAFFLGPRIFDLLERVSGIWLNSLVLIGLFLVMAFFYLDSFPLFLASSSLGIISYSLGIKRSVCLSYLIFPIILNYI